MNTKKLYIYLVLLVCSVGFAQQKKVQTSADSTRIKIGSQFVLSLKTTVDTLANVQFPEQKMFGSFEVLESFKTDTVLQKANYILTKKYGLTQWDSGKYVVPKLTILINNQPHFSDSLLVEVTNVKVDTLKQKMFDIKPIIEAKGPMGSWWKYVLIFLAIIGLFVLGYFIYKKYFDKEKATEIVYKTPFEKATVLLTQLDKKKLVEKDEVKTYYSELTNITRTYIEEVIEIPAMESTSGELIAALKETIINKKMKVKREVYDNFKKVLQKADLVKFAKSKPSEFEIVEDRKIIETVISTIETAIPKTDEEILINENEEVIKQKIVKEQKNRKVLYSILAVLIALLLTLAIFIGVKGYSFVKDNILGHPSKELLEGEWITSEYGNPSVKISTPKVLERMDAEQVMPKEAFAIIKEMQMFHYGALLDNFHIGINTTKYKGEAKVDYSLAIDGMIKAWEAQGLKNILVKQEEFTTPQGAKGQRATGSLTKTNPINKKDERSNFEILLFNQQNGLQQLIILYNEDDTYAKQIKEKVLESVELNLQAQ